MRKLFILIFAVLFLSGCGIKGNRLENQESTWKGMLNSGSCFVYTFEDSDTGVWYVATDGGVTPRLNADGTLYAD